jgi:hypothetical protein
MPELKNPRWEKFAQLYVTLGNGSEALRRAGYRTKNVQVASVDAAKLLACASIKERVTDLRAQLVFNQTMTREELAGYYTATIKTSASEIPINSPLVQSYEVGKNGIKLRIPDKNVAAAGLARLNGWDAPSKLELSAENPLTSYLRALRGEQPALPMTSENHGTDVAPDGVSG